MDYEKKYKEALELARVAAFNGHQSLMEGIFPELAESEDEKTRKEIIYHIKNCDDTIDEETEKRMIAWLEKQGETVWSEETDDDAWLNDIISKVESGCTLNSSEIKWLKSIKDKINIHYWTEEEIEPIISDYLRGAEHYGGMIGRLRCLKPKSLEKQGESYTKRDVDDAYLKGISDAKNELEKQGEQKPADNFKQKFKVGDWVTNGLCAWRIDSIDEDMYYTNHCGIDCGGDIKSIDEEYHIWTIQDAKDGDVLIDKSGSRECPFIFKETKLSDIKTDILNPLTVLGYCGIGGAGFTKGSGWGDTANCIYYPATKEQRDLLFQKMKEDGYEWDADKKELKKADVELTDFEKSLKHIMIETLECGDTHNLKADAEMLLRFAQKPAWSEKDEKEYKYVLKFVDNILNNCGNKKDYEHCKRCYDWLKSLKQRIGG